MRKDEILDRLVFSDELLEAYSRPERDKNQSSGDHWSGPLLLERVAYLRKLAHFGDGSVSETIREFSGYSISLTVLSRSGDAVVEDHDDLTVLVLDGRATLVIGGNVEQTQKIAQTMIRGTAITDGSRRDLRRGDIIHLAAGTPHQFLISGEGKLSALVLRVQQER
jgi:mannose-6-phosphate isomerase-like protein (cupin superfamily)